MAGRRLAPVVALLLALVVAAPPLQTLADIAVAVLSTGEAPPAADAVAPDIGDDRTLLGNEVERPIAKLETPQRLPVVEKKTSRGTPAAVPPRTGADPPFLKAERLSRPPVAERRQAADHGLPSPTGPPILLSA